MLTNRCFIPTLITSLFISGCATYSKDISLSSNLYCPAGTTFSTEKSTVDKLVCDVKINDGVVFPLTKDKATFIEEKNLPERVNKSYPDWYTNNKGTGIANEESHHKYYTLMEPGVDAPAYNSDNIACYSFYLRPGKTYFAHNHPSREFYFIFSGKGEWFGGDEQKEVASGAFIVHPPYLSHGFKNTSDKEDLGAFVCWWRNKEDHKNSMDHGGLATNPCLVEAESSASASAVKFVCEK